MKLFFFLIDCWGLFGCIVHNIVKLYTSYFSI